MPNDTMPCPRCATSVPLTGARLTDTSGGKFWIDRCPNCLAILRRPRELEVERWDVLQEPTANLDECVVYAEARMDAAQKALDDAHANGEDVAGIEDRIALLDRALLVARARAGAVSA